jgi:hypothetical protein
MLLKRHLQRHNDPGDEHFLDLHTVYVLGYAIKDMRALIHFNLSSPHFALNALRGIETGWGNRMNGVASFGFCRSNVDMICLGFTSMGSVNNPTCWSFITHQADGELTYTGTFSSLGTPEGCDITSQGQYRERLSVLVLHQGPPRAPQCAEIYAESVIP